MIEDVSVDFIPIGDMWDKQIQQYSFDVYHLSGWLMASSLIDKGTPKGIIAEYRGKKILMPFIARDLGNGYWDATSSYGYGGPIIDDSLTYDEINIILEQIQSFLFNEGCVSLFKRLHPLLNKQWNDNITVGQILTHGQTLISDLTKSEEEHESETSRRHRRGIKKAIKNNVVSTIEQFSEENIPIFSQIYLETMDNAKASEYYYFDNKYYYSLKENLHDRLKLFMAYHEGKAIAALLCTHCKENGIIQAHLGGTLNEYKYLEPYKLLIYQARAWGRENNYKVLHFGGGVGAQKDSIYDFKKGFSSQEYELYFKTYRLIINPMKYDDLVQCANLTSTSENLNYFPLYRSEKANIKLEET